MRQILPNPQILLLACLVVALTGCQHPMSRNLAATNPAWHNTASTAHFQKAMQTSASTAKPVATVDFVAQKPAPESPKPVATPDVPAPKATESLTGQLAGSLLEMFKTFSGR